MKSVVQLIFLGLFFWATPDVLAQCGTCEEVRSDCVLGSCCGTHCKKVSYSGGGFTILAQCSETGRYNCHQYVRAYLTQGQTGEWVPDCTASTPEGCICGNISDVSITNSPDFIQVATSAASAVYFNCDHAAVKLSGGSGFLYVSKDGYAGPVIRHAASAYNAYCSYTGYSYWEYVGKLNIPPLYNDILSTSVQVGLSNEVDNNFLDRTSTGVSYEWCAEPAGMVNFSCTDCASPTITPVGCGDVSIQVTISGNASKKYNTQCETIEVRNYQNCGSECSVTGTVSFGSYSTSLSSYHSVFAYTTSVSLSAQNASTFNWVKLSGNGSYALDNLSGSQGRVLLDPGESIKIRFEAFDASGNFLCDKITTFQRSSGGYRTSSGDNASNGEILVNRYATEDEILVYPNPARDNVTVTTGTAFFQSVELITMDGGVIQRREPGAQLGQLRMNVSGVPGGVYYLRVTTTKGETRMKRLLLH